MDSLRGGPATAQIRAGLHRFRCSYRCCSRRLTTSTPDQALGKLHGYSAALSGGQNSQWRSFVQFAESVCDRAAAEGVEAGCKAGSAALSLIPSPSMIV